MTIHLISSKNNHIDIKYKKLSTQSMRQVISQSKNSHHFPYWPISSAELTTLYLKGLFSIVLSMPVDNYYLWSVYYQQELRKAVDM